RAGLGHTRRPLSSPAPSTPEVAAGIRTWIELPSSVCCGSASAVNTWSPPGACHVNLNSSTRPVFVLEPPSLTVSVHGLSLLGGRNAPAGPAGTGIRNVHACVPVELEPSIQSDDAAPAVPGSANTGPSLRA